MRHLFYDVLYTVNQQFLERSTMSGVAIRTEGLTRDFSTLRAVDNLSLEVPQGTIFGFLGPNGAGKTTTIRLLLGVLEPTAGSAEVLGFDIRTQADQIREHSGALLEHNGLYERLSAEDNLTFYARINRLSPAEQKARVQELLTSIGLWDRRKEKVGDWSKGMKQKLAVARTMLHHPQIIFFDEPTAGFDPVAAAAFHDDLLELVKRENVTVFLNTHNLSEAEKLCSLIGVVVKGRLVRLGQPDELRREMGGTEVNITCSQMTDIALNQLRAIPNVINACLENHHLVVQLRDGMEVGPLVNLLVQQGVTVEEVRRDSASLEDVFLTLVKEDQS
jgi:ABC-2 type transport system ATP-binding protein